MRVERRVAPWDEDGMPLKRIVHEGCIFRMAGYGAGSPVVTLHGPKMGFIAAGNVQSMQTHSGAGHHLLLHVARIVSPTRGTLALEQWVVDFDPADKPERPTVEQMIAHDAEVGLPGWSAVG